MSEQSPRLTPETEKGQRAAIWFLYSLIFLCFAIVTLGGWVRLSGSGMAIPEWPFFTVSQTLDGDGNVVSSSRSVFPPTTEQGWVILKEIFVRDVPGFEEGIAMKEFKRMFWIEWGHRGVAKFIGLVYLGFLTVVFLYPAVRRQIGGLAVFGLGLLILQATLGGFVVWFHLLPIKVSLHLVNAFLFTSVLCWALMKLLRPATVEATPKAGKNPILPLAIAVYVICVVQLFSGGIMAGSKAGYTMNSWPTMNDAWVPPGLWAAGEGLYANFTANIIFIQFFHRWFAFVVAAAVFYLALRAATVEVSRVGRWALRFAPMIVILQIILGIFTLLTGVHTHLALTHQSIGLVLLLSVLVVVYETANHPVVAEEALAEREEAEQAARAREAAHA
jgi:cytochrome c oxidase assembly protein subunit 15